jgi:hypothetical protein
MPLGLAIDELLRALSASRRQGHNNQDASQARLASWSDDEYHYVEASLGNPEISFCDINIIEGKAFIRIAREDERDGPPPVFLPLIPEVVPIEFRIDA